MCDNVVPARGKIAGAYVNSALAKSDAELAGFDEALVLNEIGHVCEASAANVFVMRGGVAATPPVSEDILEGITRRTVIQLLHEDLGVEVTERPIDRTEVYLADEVLLTGTGGQIVAVTRVDHRAVGSGRQGPVTSRLRGLLSDVARGRDPLPPRVVRAGLEGEPSGTPMRLAGKVVLVTGSTRGIGEGIAGRCVAEGARVLVHGLEPDLGQAVARSLGEAAALHVDDLSSPEAAPRLVDSRFYRTRN